MKQFEEMSWSSLLLRNHITMFNFVFFQTVMNCFKEFSVGISEVCTCSFKIQFKVRENDMSLQSHIEAKVFIQVHKVGSEVKQVKICSIRFKLSSDRN